MRGQGRLGAVSDTTHIVQYSCSSKVPIEGGVWLWVGQFGWCVSALQSWCVCVCRFCQGGGVCRAATVFAAVGNSVMCWSWWEGLPRETAVILYFLCLVGQLTRLIYMHYNGFLAATSCQRRYVRVQATWALSCSICSSCKHSVLEKGSAALFALVSSCFD